ncbi:EAL domain-containing protein [Niveibacterium umoris]|uniref:Diguanylate cyclase (GGDEF)-like protein/PAS domain S-box-containing protein n=1 Tax=Niveibacterium umoris TaxID=1193620 RepID=A0A840BPY5_9RHOO|nr:EAL domain-containing protein [Niveibacterium umoris]MBB4013742.1 diguanylate cyclase (GGDEF)-like protein/PAS domain S-box-containing protein [Niveibacterium umoris]
MKGTRVQIVEDERIVALDLKQSLETLGYEVTGIAARGDEAIGQAERHHPDLVLMDIHLEGVMDGTEAAREIHQRLHIPVVFLTAYAEDETLNRAAASVPYGYLLKPYELRELRATVRMAVTRRRAELATERAEEQLRLAVDAAELGVWEWDASDDSIKVGGHFLRLLGSAPSVFNEGPQAFIERVHESDRAQLLEAIDRPEGAHAIVRMRREDGRFIWAEVHAKAFRSSPLSPCRLIGVVSDVTERREMEDKLRQASVVFRTTAEGIAIMDAERRIVSVNPAFSSLTGFSLTDVLGCNPDEFLHARRHSDSFYARLEASEQGYWNGEISCRKKNGGMFPAWEHVCAVRDEAGSAVQFVLAFSDISAIREAEAQLNHLAYHDALTGLGNRHLLADSLETEIERARRSGMPLVLLFIDLDGFKTINDTLGHAIGDALLKEIAERLRKTIRRSDTAVRLGGDEFFVIAPDVARVEDAASLAEKILQAIAAPIQAGGEHLIVSGSIGIAIFPANGEDGDFLIRAADSAMYDAKARGRNRYCFYAPDMAARALERMTIEQGLRRALEHGHFELHYQPVVSLSDQRVVAFEALLRWQHPERGLIGPERFIPVAEECGLIEPIGRWVLRAACQQGAQWLAQGHAPCVMAVNVSARQFGAEDFIDTVRTLLADTGFPPEQLELEITESTLQEIGHSQFVLDALKVIGIRIAVDDFGTGFSSLSLLKHLPIDRLKIDRSFVTDLPHDVNDVAITRAIVALSHTLELQMTAEGIETAEQLGFLRELGCQCGQGYLFARPAPAAELFGAGTGEQAVS